MSFATWAVLPAAAYLAAAVSGMLGMAGGISLLGVMTAVLPAGHVVPIHGAVQLVSNITRTLVYLRHVYWRVFFTFAPTVLLGAAAAAAVWSGGKLAWFRPGIGVFILAFLVWRRRAPKLRNLPLWTYLPLGLVTGFLAIFVGAIGPFIAPFFLRDDFPKERVIATKAVCQAWTHVLKIPAFLALGFDYFAHGKLTAVLLACVVFGTLTGRWLLSRLKQETFVVLYEAVLGAIALYLIVSGRPGA
ncbi:MAG: sulfite exporter TauE/SafE family protein [Elusimicrobiota bacterium]